MQSIRLISTLILGLMSLAACSEDTRNIAPQNVSDSGVSNVSDGEITTTDGGIMSMDSGTANVLDAQMPPGKVPTCAEIMTALGAKGVAGADASLVANYERTFARLDANNDGVVTVEEYIASGHFPESQARLIFAATDRDQNGEITEQEYVENRIITDEAKLIFEDLDTNSDGNLLEAEFVQNAPFEAAAAIIIYGYFDTDGNGEVMVPEYLRVWGAWARNERCP